MPANIELRLSPEQLDDLLKTLETRFKNNMERHVDLNWNDVQTRLSLGSQKIRSLYEMERTGGEPDVIDCINGEYVFFDFSAESPIGRRNLCYDKTALESRKANKPIGSAMDMAESMGIDVLTEEQYRELQSKGRFDEKTSSWLKTPDEIRVLGGAIFADRRYDSVFVFHNGAESYYAARGFRGSLKI